jgi:hypothetical protein
MGMGDLADGRRDAIDEYGGIGARTEPDDRLWDLAEGEASTGDGARGALEDLDGFDGLDDQDDQEQLEVAEESGRERAGADEYGGAAYGTEFDGYQG